MMRRLAVIFGMSCLLWADDQLKQKVQVVHTERADFPFGGLLRLKNSVGEVGVEGWDRPDVEIATVKSTKVALSSQDREKASHQMDRVRISVQRQGEELIVTTEFPRHLGGLPPSLDLDYNIKAPRNARLAVDHGIGEVHVDSLTSDIHVTVRNGGITLQLPQEGKYGIDAKSDFGSVTSDFPGHEKRTRWLLGHEFVQGESATHNLFLRVGFGDITIMKIQAPPALPTPLTPR
jgi:hypothetical protein